jgi:hypothetical protein
MRAGGLQGIDFFRTKDFARILEARGNVLVGHAGVVFGEMVFRPSLREQSEDEIHGKPGAPDYGLTRENGRIGHDTIFPFHLRDLGYHPVSS